MNKWNGIFPSSQGFVNLPILSTLHKHPSNDRPILYSHLLYSSSIRYSLKWNWIETHQSNPKFDKVICKTYLSKICDNQWFQLHVWERPPVSCLVFRFLWKHDFQCYICPWPFWPSDKQDYWKYNCPFSLHIQNFFDDNIYDVNTYLEPNLTEFILVFLTTNPFIDSCQVEIITWMR